MAISLALQDTKGRSGADNVSRHYKATITGNYPATTGYVVNTSTFPSSTAVFKNIKRVLFNGGCMDENGIIFRADPDEIDNSTDNAPFFYLRAYEMITGGAGYTEIPGGQALTANISLIIEGVILNGVDGGDNW